MFTVNALAGWSAARLSRLPRALRCKIFFRQKTTPSAVPNKTGAVGRVVQVLNTSVIDIEFDTIDDVPKIQNALRMTVKRETYDAKCTLVRTVSLLPRQIREAKARREQLVEKEKLFISIGAATVVARETIDSLRSQRAMSEDMLVLLERNLLSRQPGL